MWTKLNVSPEPFGICTICQKHDCGTYTNHDGEETQGWLIFNQEMYAYGYLTIGYNCVRAMCDDLEINKIIITKTVLQEPTQEDVHKYISKGLEQVEKENAREQAKQERKIIKRGDTN
jgi:hypothetical protein